MNLETTGGHSVRFNPNLYNDGKVRWPHTDLKAVCDSDKSWRGYIFSSFLASSMWTDIWHLLTDQLENKREETEKGKTTASMS